MIGAALREPQPIDLRHVDTGGRRPATPTWTVGDVVTIDGARWKIRTITTVQVELEALAGDQVWWTTTPDRLPAKEADR